MKLGVTGTRDGFSREQLAWAVEHASLVTEQGTEGVSEFHYGDCVGVDAHMLWILLASGVGVAPDLYIYPALVSEKWRAHTLKELETMGYKGQITQYSPLPPKVRNGHIAAACDELWAFPGSGGGTWDCVRKAQAIGRFGWIVYRDGKVIPL